MQNVHTHTWDAGLHYETPGNQRADSSSRNPADLTVRYEEFIREMAPFEHAIVFGLKAHLAGWWVPDEYVADFVGTDPEQWVGFASCDPTQPGYMAEFMYAIEALHLRGLHLAPGSAGFDPRDPSCDPLYEYCQKYGLPVVIQSGMITDPGSALGFGRPWLLDDVAIRYPDLKIVLTQAGQPFLDECLAVLAKNPNVYADFAGLHTRPWQFYQFLVSAQEYSVLHKLFVGSNYPYYRSSDVIAGLKNVSQIAGKSGLPPVSDEKIQAILQRDICALLGLLA